MYARAAARALIGLREARTSARLALALEVSAVAASPAAALIFSPRLSYCSSSLLINIILLLFLFFALICVCASMFKCRGRLLEISSLRFGAGVTCSGN